jgi:hypothetical protein
MMDYKDVMAALGEKLKEMDAVEKVLVASILVMVFLAAFSLMQGSPAGGAAGIGSSGGSGLGGLGMLGRGLGR